MKSDFDFDSKGSKDPKVAIHSNFMFISWGKLWFLEYNTLFIYMLIQNDERHRKFNDL